MSEFTTGQRWTFCQHYPNGYTGECDACAEIAKDAPTYTVVAVTENSIQLATREQANDD